MILVGKLHLKNPDKLKERKVYLQKLIEEGFPSAISPSSQEWTSPEFQAGHRAMLREEIKEIDIVLRKLSKT